MELIKSEDGEIRKVILKINDTDGIYPVTNLRLLKRQSDINDNKSLINDNNVKAVTKPKRQAAKLAMSKMKDIAK